MDKKKYEREIEEILRKAEEDGWASRSASKANLSDNIRRPSQKPTPPGRARLTPGLLLGLSVVAIILLMVIRPFAPVVSVLLTPLAILFFLGAIFYYYTTTASGGRSEKRWRGQTIDLSKPDDPFAGIKRTLNRWFGKRLAGHLLART